MYYYGQNYGYPQGGYPYQMGGNTSYGGVFAIILVLFILLVIIGCGTMNTQTNYGGC